MVACGLHLEIYLSKCNYTKFEHNRGIFVVFLGATVALSRPISEAGVRFPARPQVGKLVVACRWSAVYSTEP